jgi:Alpha-(1,6)-fucosyltransferase N- and catalytic domains
MAAHCHSASRGSTPRARIALPMSWLARYQDINRSFQRISVYRVGAAGVGFFSDYNNLILAMLYCLHHGIQFRLASAGANFAVRRGFTDYFLPYFPLEDNWYDRLNNRPGLLGRGERSLAEQIKETKGIEYFTQDLFDDFRSPEFARTTFDIPALGIHGDVLQAASVVLEHIWVLQPSVQQELEAKIMRLELPDEYVGFHIRRGDKVGETPGVATEDYFRAAEEHTRVRSAVVATDDYRAVLEARDGFPEWTVYTLCDESARGHEQLRFDAQARAKIFDDVVTLLADAELLFSAGSSFVTYTANMGMFLGMRRGHADRPEIHSLDVPHWQIW